MSYPAEVVWMDGELLPWADAKVHVMTHALHYGTAVFEGIRAYHEQDELFVFRLKDHMQRLVNSAHIIGFKCRYSAQQLSEAAVRLLRENRFKTSVYIRPLVFVGAGGVGLDFRGRDVQTAIIAVPFSSYFEKTGLRVCVSSWRRVPETSLPPRAKAAANYLNSALATVDARVAGFDEAILLDQEGYVSEGSGENIFLVRHNTLNTPPLSSSILEGITRETVMRLATDAGYTVRERVISRSELYVADELFFTGSAAEVQPILEVDNRKIADGQPGKVTKQLMEM